MRRERKREFRSLMRVSEWCERGKCVLILLFCGHAGRKWRLERGPAHHQGSGGHQYHLRHLHLRYDREERREDIEKRKGKTLDGKERKRSVRDFMRKIP